MATWLVPGAGARHGPHGPRGPREPPRRRCLAALEVDHGGPAAPFLPRRRQVAPFARRASEQHQQQQHGEEEEQRPREPPGATAAARRRSHATRLSAPVAVGALGERDELREEELELVLGWQPALANARAGGRAEVGVSRSIYTAPPLTWTIPICPQRIIFLFF